MLFKIRRKNGNFVINSREFRDPMAPEEEA